MNEDITLFDFFRGAWSDLEMSYWLAHCVPAAVELGILRKLADVDPVLYSRLALVPDRTLWHRVCIVLWGREYVDCVRRAREQGVSPPVLPDFDGIARAAGL